jgi:hypothetical protein
LYRRVFCVVASAFLAGSVLLVAAPQAAADHIETGISDAPPGPGMGHVSISTQPGHVVIVDIIGRFDALGAGVDGGVRPNTCDVYMGADLQVQSVALDETGSGSARFALPSFLDGIVVSGSCGTHLPPGGDMAANLNLTAPYTPLCAECSSRGVKIVFDDGPPLVGKKYPKPEAPKEPEGENCATYIPKRLETLPPGTEFALSRIKGADVGLYLQVACALVNVAASDNPLDDQNVFNSACKLLESATDPLSIGASKDFFCGTPAG